MWRFLRSIAGRPQREAPPDPQERREAPRVPARRPLRVSFSLSVLDPGGGLSGEPPLILEGETRDLSAGGLSLLVPSLSLAGRDLSTPGQPFLVEVELPSGPLRFQAAAAWHERPEAGEGGYVLGVRITEIGGANRARLAHFLEEARGRQPDDA